MNNKDSHIRQLIKRWISGDLKSQGEQRLDKAAQEDPFLREALAGLRSTTDNDHAQNMARLRKQLNLKGKKSTFTYLSPLRIAAAVALLLTAGWFVFTGPSLNNSDGIAMNKEAAPSAAPQETTAMEEAPSSALDVATNENTISGDKEAGLRAATEKESAPIPTKKQVNTDQLADSSIPIPNRKEEQNAPPPPTTYNAPVVELEEAAPSQSIELDVPKDTEKLISDAVRSADEAKITPPAKQYVDDYITTEGLNPQLGSTQTTNSGIAVAATGYRIIEGHITDSEGYPLIGVNIIEAGTGNGIVSDIDGSFSLTVKEGSNTELQCSYIGFETSYIELNEKNKYDIILSENLATLDEVSVVSYGKRKRSDELSYYTDDAQQTAPEVEPSDGYNSLKRYIRQNIPNDLGRGKVRLHFLLSDDGRPTEISVIHSTNEHLNDLVIQLISTGPNWIITAGEAPVEVEYLVRIR